MFSPGLFEQVLKLEFVGVEVVLVRVGHRVS